MASDLRVAIEFLEQYGFYDVILPFMLVFTLVFATLQKVKIFGKESKRYNLMIAFVMALMFVAASKLVEAVNKYLPVVALVLAIFLGLMLMLGIFGTKEGGPGQKFFWILAGGVAIAVGVIYIPELADILDFLEPLVEHLDIIIIGAIVIGIIVWVVKGEKPSSPSKPSTPT